MPHSQIIFEDDWVEEDKNRSSEYSSLPPFSPTITDAIKQKARFGIPSSQRRKWWFIATGGLKLLSEVGDVWANACSSSSRVQPISGSEFGGAIDILSFLTPQISEQVHNFLHVLWTQNRGVDFAPLIPTVSAILLLYLEPQLAYLCLQSMINRSRQDSWYFTLSRDQFLASIQAFRDVAEAKCPAIVKHADSMNLDVAQIGMSMFPVFFLPFMPLPVALTIFDSFAVEGRKVLVRFCLCLFMRESRDLLATTTPTQFISVLVNGMEKLNGVTSLKQFIHKAFKMYLSRGRHMVKYERNALTVPSGLMKDPAFLSAESLTEMIATLPEGSKFDHEMARKLLEQATPEELEARQAQMHREIMEHALPTVSGGQLMNDALFFMIRDRFPQTLLRYSAERCFALSEDGKSFISLFEKCSHNSPYVIIVKTAVKTVGVFVMEPLKVGRKFYGGPTTFVFDADENTCYKRAKVANTMYVNVSTDMIMFGGPKPAICLMDGMNRLTSDICETFDSPSFAVNPDGDPILEVEAYRLHGVIVE